MTSRQSEEPVVDAKSLMAQWMGRVDDRLLAQEKAQFRNTILLVIAVTTGLINVGMALAKASTFTLGLSGVGMTLLRVLSLGVIK